MQPQPKQINLPFTLDVPERKKGRPKKKEKVDFTYFNFHVSYVSSLITSFLNERSIKIKRDVINEIAKSVVVDIYYEYQRKHIQKTILKKSYKRHLYRYLQPILREIQLLN